MPKASPGLVSFNGGELSPLLDGRVDLDRYGAGLASCENFIPLPQGGLRNRTGTKFVAEIKDSATGACLLPFMYSSDPGQSFILEAGTNYFRFFKNHAAVESAPSVPFEEGHDYTVSEIPALAYVQSADVMYLAHNAHTLATLSRTSDTNWTYGSISPVTGPFLDEDTSGITLTASGVTGSVTLTASSAYFVDTAAAGHIGSLFLLWASDIDVSALQPWEPDVTYAAGDRVYYNGRIYLLADGDGNNSGTVPPTHEEGSRWDGKEGTNVQWAFESSFYGIAVVTAFTSSTIVTATVLQRLPVSLATKACTRWAEGAWNGLRKWPGALCFYQDRLVAAGSFYQPDTIWTSAVGDYLNFGPRDSSGLVAADLALTVTVSSQQVNKVLWMRPDGGGILCGTVGNEFLIAPATNGEGLSQSNIRAIPQTAYGSASIQPVQVGGATLYVQRSKRKAREAIYDFSSDRYSGRDLTILSEHITAAGGIKQMAYAQEPHNIIWMCLGDGGLIGLTYDRENEITGWHRHTLGGAGDAQGNPPYVESVSVIPSPDATQDELWLIVRRYIDGQTVRYVEYLDMSRGMDGDVEDSYFVDCGITYDGAATDTITGLDHLEGETVQVVANGTAHPDCVVASGSITLNGEYSLVHAGLFADAAVTTMKIEAGSANGTAQGKRKRIERVIARVYNSIGGKAGSPDGNLDGLLKRDSASPMSAAVLPYSGDTVLTWPYGHETAGQIKIVQDQPLPFNLLALFPDVNTKD